MAIQTEDLGIRRGDGFELIGRAQLAEPRGCSLMSSLRASYSALRTQMNLPNYFLADLPPEATLSPAMLTEACQTLKRNRERYLAQTLDATIWCRSCATSPKAGCKPDNRFRKLALESGPAETGFSHATLAKRPGQFLPPIHAGKFSCVAGTGIRPRATTRPIRCDRRRGKIQSRGSGGRAGISRSHRGGQHSESDADEHRARFADALGAIREMRQRLGISAAAVRAFDLRRRPETWRVPGNRRMARGKCRIWRTALFAEADCVTATGSDETLAAIRSRLPVHTRFLGYGHRVSFGFVAGEILSGPHSRRGSQRAWRTTWWRGTSSAAFRRT